jgi:hypothetical protein
VDPGSESRGNGIDILFSRMEMTFQCNAQYFLACMNIDKLSALLGYRLIY